MPMSTARSTPLLADDPNFGLHRWLAVRRSRINSALQSYCIRHFLRPNGSRVSLARIGGYVELS